jgi:hypothetical protein
MEWWYEKPPTLMMLPDSFPLVSIGHFTVGSLCDEMFDDYHNVSLLACSNMTLDVSFGQPTQHGWLYGPQCTVLTLLRRPTSSASVVGEVCHNKQTSALCDGHLCATLLHPMPMEITPTLLLHSCVSNEPMPHIGFCCFNWLSIEICYMYFNTVRPS